MTEILHWIIIILAAIISFCVVAIIYWFFSKLIKFYSLKFKHEIFQKAELIDDKFFITEEQYHLAWKGKIKKESKKIIIGVHEFGLNKNDFEYLSKFYEQDENVSFVTYDQRNFGENEFEAIRNFGALTHDLNDIINYFKEKYSDKEIYIVGEGIGYHIGIYVSYKNPNISGIIGINPITRVPYKMSFSDKVGYVLSYIGNGKKFVPILANALDLTNNEEKNKEFENLLLEKGFLTVREFVQIKRTIKKTYKKMKKVYPKQIIIQSKNDVYLNPKKFSNFLSKTNVKKIKIEYVDGYKHIIFVEEKSIDIINSQIKKWVNENE